MYEIKIVFPVLKKTHLNFSLVKNQNDNGNPKQLHNSTYPPFAHSQFDFYELLLSFSCSIVCLALAFYDQIILHSSTEKKS